MSINLHGSEEDEITFAVFSQEIYFQIIAALNAKLRLFQTNMKLSSEGLPIYENGISAGDEFRMRTEEFLLRCATVARIFNNKRRTRRCEILRQQLSVDPTHPLFNTGVRNAMQHYDEYLDGLVDSIRNENPDSLNFKHEYGTSEDGSFSIVWHGKSLTNHEFNQIVEELERLKALLESLNSYLAPPRTQWQEKKRGQT